MNNIYWLWEIPLAILSFVFYKIMKLVIGILFTVYLAVNKTKASQWRFFSEKMIAAPLILPVLMTKGPRWNTHAVIGTLGPFKVEQEFALDIESANNSAGSWIAVVYSFPTYKTITSLESNKIACDNKWYSVKLKPGKYTLGVRYYNRSENLQLPAIKVDGNDFVAPQVMPSDVNNFYYDLIKAKNWFYFSLHYYIFTILKLRGILPESFIRGEYLPVGAPDTFFAYNYLEKQQQLQLDIDAEIVNNCNIYFTLYDRSSLPLIWEQITTTNYNLAAPESNSYYLLRIRPKPELSDIKTDYNFQVVKKDNLVQQSKICMN
ncbi:conserved hypothetical protein [Hyella patelloides LEGE 07179]|uniref:Uncharacterized protein n=1 Tax=Hyella patelloides LEGE 07179 TaxID=945734 RepID=A0A563W1S5_9CYAN|nr:DUF6208 family protein [Hyella patelloides]VEP17664.1 conserved hypothetical protein [Hyella patelloides LEGE 07179]